MARLARSVYRSNNGHRRGNRAEPQFSRRGNPPPSAPARDRPSSPGQRPSAHQPRRITGWNAGLRPASPGSAKPAPTTPPPANLTPANPRITNRAESRRHGAPVSDRHRAGARNPPQQRRPPPISRLRTHASPTAQNHGDMERRSPTGIARERETRPNNAAPRQSHACKPTHHQPRRITPTWSRRSPTGIARQRETRTNNAAPRQSHVLRTHASPTAQNHGDMERRSPTGIARQGGPPFHTFPRETRPDNAGPVLSVASGPVLDVA